MSCSGLKQWERFFEGKTPHLKYLACENVYSLEGTRQELDWEYCWREPPRVGKHLGISQKNTQGLLQLFHRAQVTSQAVSRSCQDCLQGTFFSPIMKDARVNGWWRFAPRSREQVVDRQCVARLGFLKGGFDRSLHEDGKEELMLQCTPWNVGFTWTIRHLLRKTSGCRVELSQEKVYLCCNWKKLRSGTIQGCGAQMLDTEL